MYLHFDSFYFETVIRRSVQLLTRGVSFIVNRDNSAKFNNDFTIKEKPGRASVDNARRTERRRTPRQQERKFRRF